MPFSYLTKFSLLLYRMWARQFGAMSGVTVPNQAAEHYYLITDDVPGMDPRLPVLEDVSFYDSFGESRLLSSCLSLTHKDWDFLYWML